MDYLVTQPDGELKNYISHYWVGTWNLDSTPPNDSYYVIASSTTEFTFGFSGAGKEDDLLFSIVHGHTQEPLQKMVEGYYHLIGVSIYSHAIPSLFNIPAYDLNREFLPLSIFLGGEGEELNDRIANARTSRERLEILDDYFKGRLKNQRESDVRMLKAIKEVKRFNGNSKIIDLASDSFLSQKQFNRRFKDFSGFNPKTFSKIIRLESAIKNYPAFPSLTELALKVGYYDQAHFIREFKELTGFSPREFWKLSEK